MRREALALLCAVALLGVSCQPPPPPPPPPAQPAPPPPPPPPTPPPPPPKCESLEEKCLAAADTRMAFGAQGASFAPPVGWTCAFEPIQPLVSSPDAGAPAIMAPSDGGAATTEAIAVAPDGGAVILFSDASGKKPDQLGETLARLLGRLQVIGVEMKALSWAKPHAQWQAGSLPISVWQVEKPSQGWSRQARDPVMNGAPGAVLVAVAEVGDKVVMGVSFLARSASTTLVGPIKASVESLQVAP